jgi:hypothetical protein
MSKQQLDRELAIVVNHLEAIKQEQNRLQEQYNSWEKERQNIIKAKSLVTEHKSPENAGIKPSACISTEATEFLPCNSSRSESVKAGRHRDNSCVEKDGGSK